MSLYINLFGRAVPSYGLMIALGVLTANAAAWLVIRKKKYDFNDFLILEAYGILGGFVGAKLLYLMVSWREIDWRGLSDPVKLNELMQSGFVFYGGLIGGLLAVVGAGRLHKIKAAQYAASAIFLIPMIHSFGRVGCFLAGCCYGIPYDGPGAVVFPENSFALSGVSLFPVQLVEAVCLLGIALWLFVLQWGADCRYTVELYLITYGIVRFILEYFRYDEIRGRYAGISTSQWISLALIAAASVRLWSVRSRNRRRQGV